jgi:hypothetical protein
VKQNQWQCLGKVKPNDLIIYCDNFTEILHSSGKYVNPSYLKSLPFQERYTLQLVYAINFSVKKQITSRGKSEWRGTIEVTNGQKLSDAKITDPMFIKKLEAGHQPGKNCLVTVSLSIPWAPSLNWEGEKPCWKLIAAVIELPDLPNSDLILS